MSVPGNRRSIDNVVNGTPVACFEKELTFNLCHIVIMGSRWVQDGYKMGIKCGYDLGNTSAILSLIDGDKSKGGLL